MSRRKLELRLSGEPTPKRSLGSIGCRWQFANDREIRRMQRLQGTPVPSQKPSSSFFVDVGAVGNLSCCDQRRGTEEEGGWSGMDNKNDTNSLTRSTQSTLTAQRTHNNDTISREYRSCSDRPTTKWVGFHRHCKDNNNKFRLLCFYN